eukprot:m.161919 g.161919  ORF g.161919 m.161919 type:complete len:1480 (-) comp17657_c0_seq4:152-4591(-)
MAEIMGFGFDQGTGSGATADQALASEMHQKLLSLREVQERKQQAEARRTRQLASGGSSRKRRDLKLAVRVCPLSEEEAASCLPTVSVESRRVLAVTDTSDIGKDGDLPEPAQFAFDHVFGPTVDQTTVFEHSARPIVAASMRGYSGSFICYGQRGTGKGLTMEGCGSEGDARGSEGTQFGLVVRCGDMIITKLPETAMFEGCTRKGESMVVLQSSCLLVGEDMYDLLREQEGGGSSDATPDPDLEVAFDTDGHVTVRGLTQHEVTASTDADSNATTTATATASTTAAKNITAAELLSRASKRRSQLLRELTRSSSSGDPQLQVSTLHFLQIAVVLKSGERETVSGRLMFVSLPAADAKSIDTDATQRPQSRASKLYGSHESLRSNDSDDNGDDNEILPQLSAFRTVVLALSSGSDRVPYRYSKLTGILRNALGGNCKTSMIVTVSPSPKDYPATLRSIQFARRAFGVKNEARVSKRYLAQRALLRAYARELGLEYQSSDDEEDYGSDSDDDELIGSQSRRQRRSGPAISWQGRSKTPDTKQHDDGNEADIDAQTQMEAEQAAMEAFDQTLRATGNSAAALVAAKDAFRDAGGLGDPDAAAFRLAAMVSCTSALSKALSEDPNNTERAETIARTTFLSLCPGGNVDAALELARKRHNDAVWAAKSAYRKAVEGGDSSEEALDKATIMFVNTLQAGDAKFSAQQAAALSAAAFAFEEALQKGSQQADASKCAQGAFLTAGGKGSSVTPQLVQLAAQEAAQTAYEKVLAGKPGAVDEAVAAAQTVFSERGGTGTATLRVRDKASGSTHVVHIHNTIVNNHAGVAAVPQKAVSETTEFQEALRLEREKLALESSKQLAQMERERHRLQLQLEQQRLAAEKNKLEQDRLALDLEKKKEAQASARARAEEQLEQARRDALEQRKRQEEWNELIRALSEQGTGVELIPQETLPKEFAHATEPTFSGASVIEWLMKNQEGATKVQAEDVAQKLIDCGALTPLFGSQEFASSETDLYQFSWQTSRTMIIPGTLGRTRSSSSRMSGGSYDLRESRGASSSQFTRYDSMFSFQDTQQGWGDSASQTFRDYNPSEFERTAGQHPLFAAIMNKAKPSEVKKLVNEYGVDHADHCQRSALSYAVIADNAKLCEVLIKCGASINKADEHGYTPLLWAAFKGFHGPLAALIKHSADIAAIDEKGRTALHWSTKQSSTRCLDLLLKTVPRTLVNKQDAAEHLTPLHWAVANKHLSHTKLLLRAKADPTIMDAQGRTSVNYAIHYGSPDCLTCILALWPGALHQRDARGRTALHLACEYLEINSGPEPLQCVAALLSIKQTDVNCTDLRLTTPLHWAAVYNRPKLARALVGRGANPYAEDSRGMTPLSYAIKRGFVEVADAMGGGTDDDGLSAQDYRQRAGSKASLAPLPEEEPLAEHNDQPNGAAKKSEGLIAKNESETNDGSDKDTAKGPDADADLEPTVAGSAPKTQSSVCTIL